MDPTHFHIDWQRLSDVLLGIVVMSFLLERALALLFESSFFIKHLLGKSLKELIAFILGVIACWIWDFDAFSIVFLKNKVTLPGIILTGAVVAGGSKASVKLFRDILGIRSIPEACRQEELKCPQKEGADNLTKRGTK